MKKRLSLLMAALMIITLLPMSAFAVGSPKVVVQNVTTAESDSPKKVVVGFEFKKVTGIVEKLAPQRLVLTLANSKFAKDGGNFKPVKVKWDNTEVQSGAQAVVFTPVDETTLFANFDEQTIGANTSSLTFEFEANFKDSSEGDANFVVVDNSSVDASQQQDTLGAQTVKFAVVKLADEAELSISVKDKEKTISFDGGTLSQFEIKNFSKVKDNDKLEISLDDSAYSFVQGETKVYVDGANAFLNPNQATWDNGKISIPKEKLQNAKSIIVLPVLDKMGRRASEGDVSVDVKIVKDNKSVTTNSAVIGKVVDYNVTLKIVEKNKKEIPSVWGGEKANIKVTLEGPKGSIDKRMIDFTLEGASVKPSDITGVTLANYDTAKPGRDLDKEGYFKDGKFSIENDKDSKVEFFMTIETDGDKDGVATLTAAQRGWEAKADAAKITPKFSVKTEEMPVKKGEARETANIVITEAKAGLLSKSDKLTLTFSTRRNYTQFASKGIKVEATNGMQFGEVEYREIKDTDDSNLKFTRLVVPITKHSKGEPAVITISGIKVLVDGSSTDDVIKVHAGLNGMTVDSENYIKVVKEYDLESILTVFTIGQTQYTVNGQAKTAASAPYIKNGKTMLPIRALSESLGLAVQWNGATKTATFTNADKVAAVTIGAEKMFVNGTPIPLAAKAELVNGTTFVELRSLATAFGVQIDWDAAAKTATVSK